MTEKKPIHILLKVAISLFIALVIFIVSLPWILSTSYGTSILTKLVNGRIPGKVEIKDLSLSWFGHQKIQQASLKSPSGDEILGFTSVEADSALYTFLFDPLHAGNLRLIGFKGVIVQDVNGVTNLEDALGISKQTSTHLKTPVFLDNINAEIKSNGDDSVLVKAVGLTRQNEIKGQFTLTANLGKKSQINLKAEKFPVLVLDQTLTMKNPALCGLLLNTIGDYFDVVIDESQNKENAHSLQIVAKSPFINAELKGNITNDIVQLKSGSNLHFNIPVDNLKNLAHIFGQDMIQPQSPLQGEILLNNFDVMLNQNDLATSFGKASLSLQPSQFVFKGEDDPIQLKKLNIIADLPQNLSEMTLTIQGEGSQKDQPITADMHFAFAKRSALNSDILSLLKKGIRIEGDLNLGLASLQKTLGSEAKIHWAGDIKETNSMLAFSLNSKKLTLPDSQLIIEKIPLSEYLNEGYLYSDIKGQLTIQKPAFNDLVHIPLAPIQTLTIPWLIDPDDNAFRISMIGTRPEGKENIKGTIRMNQFITDQGLDFKNAAMQMDIKLHGFDTLSLSSFLPEHNINEVIGNEIDGEITATRDLKGNLHGKLDFSTPKNSQGFLKTVSGKFALSNDNRDITFDAFTTQAFGSTQFTGTFHNLFDDKGKFRIDLASISLQGSLKRFPVVLMTRMATGNLDLADKLEAILGSQMDADIYAEIKDKQGPIRAKIKGLNGQMDFDAKIVKGDVYLEQPLKASVKVTPQFEQKVLRELIPFLGSVQSSEGPVEFTIYPEGFRMSLQSIDISEIDIGKAELKLNKMQFSRDSQLGKIVALLGINSNIFEVRFTPVYFSLRDGLLQLSRSDMLIANRFPLANWGTIDFPNNGINIIVGISGTALKNAYPIRGINNSEMLQVPIRGALSKPQIDMAQVTARISALVAQSDTSSKSGKLLGTVIDIASDILTKDKSVPPPTTNPLPWQNMLEDSEDTAINEKTTNEKPLEEHLKKGAKKLIKELFGK